MRDGDSATCRASRESPHACTCSFRGGDLLPACRLPPASPSPPGPPPLPWVPDIQPACPPTRILNLSTCRERAIRCDTNRLTPSRSTLHPAPACDARYSVYGTLIKVASRRAAWSTPKRVTEAGSEICQLTGQQFHPVDLPQGRYLLQVFMTKLHRYLPLRTYLCAVRIWPCPPYVRMYVHTHLSMLTPMRHRVRGSRGNESWQGWLIPSAGN